jgi:hypothetical protein
MDIATWIVLGLLIACCGVPMLLMAWNHRRRGSRHENQDRPQGR